MINHLSYPPPPPMPCPAFRLLGLALGLVASTAAATVVLEGGPGVTFMDLGLDSASGAVTLVGAEEGSGDPVAKVFYVAPDRSALSAATLVGLGPGTQVFGIASDGSRIAGSSMSPGSESIGEGTTWLSLQPTMPVGIGFVPSFDRSSLAVGAWSGGIVGDHDGLQDAVKWTPSGGLVVLEDGEGLSATFDVSADGQTIVGFATSIAAGGAPAYWNDAGFHALATPNGDQGQADSISPHGAFVGGGIDFLEFDPFDGGTQAMVWSLVDGTYEYNLLTQADGSRFKGRVLDITNSSFAVGFTQEEVPAGFVWRPGWAEPLDFNTWLAAVTGVELPGPSSPVVAVAEDPTRNELWFALESPARVIGVTLPPIPGDYDADGDVDTDDYAAWAATHGQTVPLTTGADGNANGRLDAADYTVWRDAYATAMATTVPEPVAAGLALLGIALLPGRKRFP